MAATFDAVLNIDSLKVLLPHLAWRRVKVSQVGCGLINGNGGRD